MLTYPTLVRVMRVHGSVDTWPFEIMSNISKLVSDQLHGFCKLTCLHHHTALSNSGQGCNIDEQTHETNPIKNAIGISKCTMVSIWVLFFLNIIL